MNPMIALMGQQPDMLGIMGQANQAAAFQNESAERNALRALLQQRGADVMSGDQNALAALAQVGPSGAELGLGVQRQQHGMSMDNQRLDLAQQQFQHGKMVDYSRLGIAREQLEMDRGRMGMAAEAAAREAEAWSMQKSAAERASTAAQLEQEARAYAAAKTPQEFDYLAKKFGDENMMGGFEQRHILLAGIESAFEMLNPQPQSTPGKIQADINAGILDPQTATAELSPDERVFESKIRMLTEDLQKEGLPPDRAATIARGIHTGRFKADRHPTTGELQVVDMSSGQVMYRSGQQPGEAPPPPENASSMPRDVDFSGATGTEGFMSAIANTAAEILGQGLVAPENERAMNALQNLQNQTMISLADAVAGKPSNFLLQEFQKLTVTPGSPFQCPGRSRDRLSQTRDMIDEGIALNMDVIQSDVTGKDKADAQQNISRLRRLRDNYNIVLESFGDRRDEGDDIDALIDKWGADG